jgi:hypothetical protein
MIAVGRTGLAYERGSYRLHKRHHGLVHRWSVPSPLGAVRAVIVWNVIVLRFPVGRRHRVPIRYVKVPR